MVFKKKEQLDPAVTPSLESLLAERESILAEKPHLREAQKEIDRLLSTSCDPSVRLDIIFMLLSEKMEKMSNVLNAVRLEFK